MKQPTRTERMDAIRAETAEYVALRERLGMPITFVEALRSHRTQCLSNHRDSGERFWMDRVDLLDALLLAEGVAA